MSSKYMNDILTPVKGFIDFNENGEIILVPTIPCGDNNNRRLMPDLKIENRRLMPELKIENRRLMPELKIENQRFMIASECNLTVPKPIESTFVNNPINNNNFINLNQVKKRKANDNNDNPNSYECKQCHKKFVRKAYWIQHELSHETTNLFECKQCHKKFMHNIHLTQHMEVHKEKQHQCDICGLKVSFKFNLKKHRKTHIAYKDENGNIKYLTVK
jgi:hypothetical protein